MSNPDFFAPETVAGMYKRLAAKREPYIRRAEEAALYTIPSLFPKEGSNGTTEFRKPYQALGARGLNNLTAKILLAMFPPNTTWFRLGATEKAKEEVKQQIGEDAASELDHRLSLREQKIMRYHETRQFRVTLGEAIKQLLMAGNGCLFMPPKEGGIKLYKLSSYVCERDGLGNVFNLIAEDVLAYAALPDAVQELISRGSSQHSPDQEVKIYTRTFLQDDRWISYQEVDGQSIPDSGQDYPKDLSPWIPLRMSKVDGESYGRGYIEEHIGDLESYDRLCQAMLEYAAIAAQIKFLVNPNGQTQARRLVNSKNGDYIPGRKQDVEALTLDKFADFRTAKEQADTLAAGLSMSFLLNSAVQRQAERVTAEEIRFVARELEDTLGGIYSLLSQELQLPLVRRSVVQLQTMGELEELPKGTVEPTITTGLEALGRGHDLEKLKTFLSYMEGIPEAASYMKLGGLLTMVATALSMDISSLVRTEEEVQQANQLALLRDMLTKGAPQLAGGFAQAQLQEGGK
ncbi:portal protein [Anaeroselena agilis]|uniref:Portal protein n=1 Tax=Anaeroselena agilis TaxID=3063788 RepID=A0ABU3NV06_9FIRM|nr:portal protein [Selenomonadales bacterium 4137-cl]